MGEWSAGWYVKNARNEETMKWEEYLHLVEFDYNNGYCESLGTSPFEVLYGRKWRVPTNWNNPENKLVLGLKILAEMENIVKKVH